MTVPANVTAARLRFMDRDNIAQVTDLGKISDNNPINNAKPIVETAIEKAKDATAALKGLQKPLNDVTKAINSGGPAAEMLKSMQDTIKTNTPDMRAVSAAVTGVVNNTTAAAADLSRSVVGSVNSAISGAPGVIGKIGEVSSNVKAELMKSSVVDYVKTGIATGKQYATTVSHTVNGIRSGMDTAASAARSVMAAKESLTNNFVAVSRTLGLDQSSSSPQSASRYALSTQLQHTLSNTMSTQPTLGTSSQLPPVASSNGQSSTAENLPEIPYSDKAIVFLMSACTWFRALSSLEYIDFTELTRVYGTSDDHWQTLSNLGSDHQTEQLQNFNRLVERDVPDPYRKTLFVVDTLQRTIAKSVVDLSLTTHRQGAQNYINHFLSTNSVRSYLTVEDYDRLVLAVQNLTYRIEIDSLGYTTQEECDAAIGSLFGDMVTGAVVWHYGAPASVPKYQGTSGLIAAFTLIMLIRDLYLRAYVYPQALMALNSLCQINLEKLVCTYNDPYGFIFQHKPIYWTPSMDALPRLGPALIRHYHFHRTAILAARDSLTSAEEQQIFDRFTSIFDVMDTVRGTVYQEILDGDVIRDYQVQPVTYPIWGRALGVEALANGTSLPSTSGLPPHCFDIYSTVPSMLYIDDQVAFFQ